MKAARRPPTGRLFTSVCGARFAGVIRKARRSGGPRKPRWLISPRRAQSTLRSRNTWALQLLISATDRLTRCIIVFWGQYH